ncbi:PH domain-containing protein [Streptomyces sp. NPDC006739]|uniref:PH domain-containing protein n=1 Tax=Streptomyces sp. NPDC006739 TaxID=3364763 RepID=UPI0036B2A0A8
MTDGRDVNRNVSRDLGGGPGREVICLPRGKRALWFLVAAAAAGAVAAVLRSARSGGPPDIGAGVGLLLALLGVAALRKAAARVRADAYGVHVRTLLSRRSVPWHQVAELLVRRKYSRTDRGPKTRRVLLALHDGGRRLLPLPRGRSGDDPAFEATLDALRALHRRHGGPESAHARVVPYPATGSGWALPLGLCALPPPRTHPPCAGTPATAAGPGCGC